KEQEKKFIDHYFEMFIKPYFEKCKKYKEATFFAKETLLTKEYLKKASGDVFPSFNQTVKQCKLDGCLEEFIVLTCFQDIEVFDELMINTINEDKYFVMAMYRDVRSFIAVKKRNFDDKIKELTKKLQPKEKEYFEK
ncbi:9017_t:CDS:1, partial [Racocetra fulgida]